MSAYTEYDYLFKVLVLGDAEVGKTALVNRYYEQKFDTITEPTNGVDFKLKSITYKEKLAKFQIWDSSGAKKFRKIVEQYCRGMHGYFLCFDLTNKESFDGLKEWFQQIKQHQTISEAHLVLIGTKSDLKEKRQIDASEITKIIEEFKIEYFEVSSKEDKNITEVFDKMFETIAQQGMVDEEEEEERITDELLKNEETKNGFLSSFGCLCCCCRLCCCCCSFFF